MDSNELDRVFCQLGTWKCRLKMGKGKSDNCSCAPGNRACEYVLKQKGSRQLYRLGKNGRKELSDRYWNTKS